MGAVLILAPIGADYLFQRNLAALLTKEQSISAAVIPHLGVWYRVVCWLTGSLMVLVGTVAASADARASHFVRTRARVQDKDEEEEEEDDGETA